MKAVVIRVDEKIYDELEKKAKAEGFLTISEYIHSLILRSLGQRVEIEKESEAQKKVQLSLDRIVNILERRLQDKLNPFTSKVDDLGKKMASIIERIEDLEQRLTNIENQFSSTIKKEREKEKERIIPKKSAIDILKEQKIMFERDIASRIKDRDSFFAKLQKNGAIIVETKDERIAIENTFWNEFIKKIESITTNNEDEIKKILNSMEYRLFNKLKESAIIAYDAALKKWAIYL